MTGGAAERRGRRQHTDRLPDQRRDGRRLGGPHQCRELDDTDQSLLEIDRITKKNGFLEAGV